MPSIQIRVVFDPPVPVFAGALVGAAVGAGVAPEVGVGVVPVVGVGVGDNPALAAGAVIFTCCTTVV
jgi:hypothetical protein